MEEIWKFYKETNSYRYGKRVYYVSNFGNVKCNGELFKVPINSSGYKILYPELLHHIVAELFVQNTFNNLEVDHIDTNRLNNRVDNLRWVTHKENCNNKITKEKMSISKSNPTELTKQKLSNAAKICVKNRQRDEKGRFI